MSMNKKENNKTVRSRLYTSVLLVLLALVAVTAATVAWFSIADRAKVKTMSLDIVTDADLRMDLDPHSTIDQYVKTLSFEQIAARIQQEKEFSMETTPLEPVTTTDYETFTYENGTTVENTSGAYLEFTLHFMAAKDMVVHLTSANSSSGAEDGTLVMSENAALPESMRIAFSADGTIWNYGKRKQHRRYSKDIRASGSFHNADKRRQCHVFSERRSGQSSNSPYLDGRN